MGTAVNTDYLPEKKYEALAAQQYNLVTAEHSCKMAPLQPEQGKFNFTGCDEIRDFALTKVKGAFRGHNLCWWQNYPAWVQSLTPMEKRQALINHINEVGKHYGSDAFAWDVVNEAISDDSNETMRRSVWYPDVKDYIDVAFTTARKAFPAEVKLFYNEYVYQQTSKQLHRLKAERMYDLVRGMMDRKVPIDGVGLQMHIFYDFDDAVWLKAFMERFDALGLEVHFTELDVSFKEGPDGKTPGKIVPFDAQRQARIYADLMKVCLEVNACKNFETWGFTDKYTWMGTNARPLPFDSDYQPKAAVGAMLKVLTNGQDLQETTVV